ncbi:hypothetical protein [Pedobacter foliorum]|uniref:hypothetical protein n=1 Tax=Pedobacter foliorum TaxID=2739058 RepID=UPI0015654157|nr:hypothetical protein [Pedobacter foliorum]NRF37988.1 hypothetical protein [Pedobacter foliorum]
MKRIFTHMHLCLLVITTTLMVSCEKEKLSNVLVNEKVNAVDLSLANKIDIGGGNNFSLDNDKLIIPVTVNLSGAAGKAFNVQITGNIDTIPKLITDGVLPAGTIALEEQMFNFPPVLDIAYGVTSATFDLLVSRTFIERNYDKKLAIAVKISGPSKSNKVEAGKGVAVVLIDAAQAIAPDKVHYVSFVGGGKTPYLVPNANNFVIGSQDITIPLSLSLVGDAGPDFTVDFVRDDAVATELINNGTLKNTSLYTGPKFSIPVGKLKFADGATKVETSILLNTSEAMGGVNNKKAIGLRLKNPTKFQLDANKATMVVVFDPVAFSRPYTVPFVIKGGIGQVSDMIPAAFYDQGGEGVAYHDDNGKDGMTSFRPGENVDVGNYNPPSVVGWCNTDEWLTYTVNIEADGEYELNTLLGCPGDDGRYSILMDGVAITPVLAGAKTPGSYGDQQPNYSTVQLTKGRHIMKFYENKGAYDVRGWIFTRKK